MSPRALIFGALLSAPLWALGYIAVVLIPESDVVGALALCVTATVLLVWGIRKELSS